MDFPGRNTPLYIDLGDGHERRRRSLESDGRSASIQSFRGTRLHGFTLIAHVERGHGTVSGSFGRFAVGPGDVIVLPPGSASHRFDGTYRVETFAVRTPVERGAIVRSVDVPPDLFARSTTVVVDALREAPARATFARTEVERILIAALLAIANEPATVRLATVAHALGYTADGLRTLMRRTTGRGFAAWRDALLMARARSSLDSPTPFARVARDLSIDPSYLHRRFARAHGTTPARWRSAATPPPAALAHEWDALARFFDTPPRLRAENDLQARETS